MGKLEAIWKPSTWRVGLQPRIFWRWLRFSPCTANWATFLGARHASFLPMLSLGREVCSVDWRRISISWLLRGYERAWLDLNSGGVAYVTLGIPRNRRWRYDNRCQHSHKWPRAFAWTGLMAGYHQYYLRLGIRNRCTTRSSFQKFRNWLDANGNIGGILADYIGWRW